MSKDECQYKRAACALLTRFSRDMERLEILAVSRKDSLDEFGLPGGKCELNESYEETMKRELLEETGVKALKFHPTFSYCANGYHTMTYQVYLYEGTPVRQPGEGMCEWISPKKLIEGPFGHYNKKLLLATGYESYLKNEE